MSDIHYDTRTGAVMAGGLSGTGGAKTGAAVKQKLRIMREESAEARNKSNQDLILLLENYNDQTDLVLEALKTGEAQAVLGGWAVTSKKGKTASKNKKNSESDVGQDNVSETSNSKVRATQSASTEKPPVTVNDSKSTFNGGSTVRAAQSTDAGAKPSNQQNNRDSSGNRKKPQNTGDIHIRIHLDETSLSPKEVPVPDIYTHAASFSQLLAQRTETHMADIKSLDFAFEQVRRIVQNRYEMLRRNLDRSDEEVTELLYNRHSHSSELSDRVAQSNPLMPKEYSEWQQDVSNFTADYKYDLHLAATPRFSYSLEEIQNELTRFGNVASILPSYSYKPSAPVASLSDQSISSNKPTDQAPTEVAKQQPVRSSNPAPRNAPRNDGRGQNNSNRNNTKTLINSAGNGNPNSNRNGDIPRQADRRGNNYRTAEPRKAVENRPDPRERVTIVPKDGTGVGPMESLVISGGDLSEEEMAALTRSLKESLQFSNLPRSNPSRTRTNGASYDGGDFCEQDIFSGGAVWTNSNATFVADQWNSGADQQQQQQQQPTPSFSASAEGFSQGDIHINIHTRGEPPARGGPGYRGSRRGGRGTVNGRGSRGRGNFPSRGRSTGA